MGYDSTIRTILHNITLFIRDFYSKRSVAALALLFAISFFGAFQEIHQRSDFSGEEATRGGLSRYTEDLAGAVQGGILVPLPEEAVSLKSEVVFPDDAVLLGRSSVLGTRAAEREGILRYKVRQGDTISSLAARFGISADTIRWANPSLQGSLRKGQELTILPVTGIVYEAREGDTLQGVTSRYGVNQDLFKEYNSEYQKVLGDHRGVLILPYAKPKRGEETKVAQTLPDFKSYFALPVNGWNWGELHPENAVDIANACGTPVYAAAEGLVVPDETFGDGSSGWNGGYGTFILLEHPNGTKTRYAHLGKAVVNMGDLVSRGDHIGLMGSTGSSHGPSGCHLHFEVIGAKNPFAIR